MVYTDCDSLNPSQGQLPLRMNLASAMSRKPVSGLNPSQGQLPLRILDFLSLLHACLFVLIPLRVNCLFGWRAARSRAFSGSVLIPLRVNCLFGSPIVEAVEVDKTEVLIPLRVNCLFGSAAMFCRLGRMTCLNPSQGQLPLRIPAVTRPEAC